MTLQRRFSELAIGRSRSCCCSGFGTTSPPSRSRRRRYCRSPGLVFTRFVQLLGDPTFLSHVGGHALSPVLRLRTCGRGRRALGIAGAGSPIIGSLLRPVIRVLAPVPKIALYPAFILTLGFDHSSKIALVFADAVFPILLATYQGALSVEPKLVWSARAMGVSRRKALFTVVLTAALPSILTGCRIGLVISCIVVFLSEMISSTDGLGQLLVRAARNFQTVDMFVPIIAISALGLMLNFGFNMLRARLLVGFPEES